MPAASSSALALAARLRALDDPELTRLLRDRAVRTAGISDWFDLAEALLDRANVQAALERLDRPTLVVLAAAADLAARAGAPTAARIADRIGTGDLSDVRARADAAVAAGLLGEESGRYAPWDAVVDQLAAWPSFGLPDLDELLWAPAPPALVPVSRDDRDGLDRVAGERAFATTSRVAELVLELAREPARRLARGGLALPESRRLAAAIGVEADELAPLIDLAERAELVADDGAASAATEAGVAWAAERADRRWGALAGTWLDRLAPDIRSLLASRAAATWDEGLLDYLRWFFPAGGDAVLGRVRDARDAAALLGIIVDETPSSPGAALLTDGLGAAVATMNTLFPAEVDQVYLQHDLSIISPGPLRSDLDARLRGFADTETRALASTYRVSAASLARSLASGETERSLREFLDGISLTGIPQPLDYLLRETAERFGSLRVSILPEVTDRRGPESGARSQVRSDDTDLIGQLEVDTGLATLGLRRTGPHRLVSRSDARLVYWTVADARYPVVLEDVEGRVVPPGPRRGTAPAPEPPRDGARDLVTRLRGGATISAEATGEAWIARQLELAAKGKATVVVTVRMPDGSATEFRLEPASVAGGRLRGRDPRADLERTLPLSSITSVTPLT